MPVLTVEAVFQKGRQDFIQFLFGGNILQRYFLYNIDVQKIIVHLFQDGQIQLFPTAEVIIDRRGVHVCSQADVFAGGSVVAVFGKKPAGAFDNAGLGRFTVLAVGAGDYFRFFST